MNPPHSSYAAGKLIAGFVLLLALSPILAPHGEAEPQQPASWCDDSGVTPTTVGC